MVYKKDNLKVILRQLNPKIYLHLTQIEKLKQPQGGNGLIKTRKC